MSLVVAYGLYIPCCNSGRWLSADWLGTVSLFHPGPNIPNLSLTLGALVFLKPSIHFLMIHEKMPEKFNVRHYFADVCVQYMGLLVVCLIPICGVKLTLTTKTKTFEGNITASSSHMRPIMAPLPCLPSLFATLQPALPQ